MILECTLASVLALSGPAPKSLSQNVTNAASQEDTVVLTKLSPLVYPPLARQTRISGDVVLMLGVRQDGIVESAIPVSGHLLLQQAALDSARQSRFDCLKCTEPITSLRLVYTFQLIATNCCSAETKDSSASSQPEQQIPRVIQSLNHVTLIDQPTCICDPGGEMKVRSAKCLYLWRCGHHAL